MNTRVRSVLSVRPPITVIANVAPIEETYSAVPMASGSIAITVVEAVMSIGLKSCHSGRHKCPLHAVASFSQNIGIVN